MKDKCLNLNKEIGAILILREVKKMYTENTATKEVRNKQAKRVNIVSLKMVRESSILYKERSVRSPEDAYKLVKEFLADADREVFVVACLDTKNQPTAINICHVGSLNSSIAHPREVMKAAILSNSSSILVAHNHPSSARVSACRRQLSTYGVWPQSNLVEPVTILFKIGFASFSANLTIKPIFYNSIYIHRRRNGILLG